METGRIQTLCRWYLASVLRVRAEQVHRFYQTCVVLRAGKRYPELTLGIHLISLQVHLTAGRGIEDAAGLFWVLDEEVRVEGSSDSVVLERLHAGFEKKASGAEGKGGWGGHGA